MSTTTDVVTAAARHPRKDDYVTALREMADRFEAEAEFPEDEEVQVAPREIVADIAGWLLKEAFDWGYYKGYEAASGKPPCKMPERVEKATAAQVQPGLFGESEEPA